MIVGINKFDNIPTNEAEDRYNFIKDEVSNFLKKVGYRPKKILFVPISGWKGDNLVEPSENMIWYKGPTLF